MKIVKLHLLPALLLIAAVKLDIVASVINYSQFQPLKGQSSSSCPPVATQTTSTTTDPVDINTDSTETSTPDDTSTYSDYYKNVARSVDFDLDSLPENAIDHNAEINAADNTGIAHGRQTILVQRRPPRRRAQRRRRRQNRRRPSAQKRRRGNRRSSNNRRRRRRGGQRRGQRKGVRRVYVRRRNANRRISDQRN